MGSADPNYCATLNLFVGNACDDNNPTTINDIVNANCECLGTPDPNYCEEYKLFIGSPCDDGDDATQNDTLGADCICGGKLISEEDEIVLANVIMPDGSADNQNLEINVTKPMIATLFISNRWGNVVSRKNEHLDAGRHILWDGRFNGELLDGGVYAYTLVLEYQDNIRIVKQGNVTLIR